MVYTISEISFVLIFMKGEIVSPFYLAIYLVLTMEIFNDSRKIISNLVEKKISILRGNPDFNQKYIRLSDAIDELTNCLTKEQNELLDEIIKLFYQTEEYYFALSYSLGVKYGEDLKRL